MRGKKPEQFIAWVVEYCRIEEEQSEIEELSDRVELERMIAERRENRDFNIND